MTVQEKQKLKTILGEIINGCSPFKRRDSSTVYFRHADSYVSSIADSIYEEAYLKAVDSGLVTTSQKLKSLQDEKEWTNEDENKIVELQQFLTRYKLTKSKVFRKIEIEQIDNDIKNTQTEINKLEEKRTNLIGFTAEIYAARKSNFYFSFISLYKDRQLTIPFYSMEEFEDLEEREMREIFSFYEFYQIRFTSDNLKKIAISPFFLNSYSLCSDNPFYFYGKPVIQLTFHQIELFSYGRYYKNILSETTDIPPEAEDDPDKLVEFFEARKNAKELMEKSGKDGMNTSIAGLSNEDRKRLGIEENTAGAIDLAKEAKKKGGRLNMEDMLRLQGL